MITAYRNRNIFWLSVALGLIFFGFNAAEQHFTAFYQSIGLEQSAFLSLAILYGSIVIGNLIGPAIERKLGIRVALLVGYLPYFLLVALVALKNNVLVYFASFLLGSAGGIGGAAEAELLFKAAPKAKRGEYGGAIHSVRTLGGFLGIVTAGVLIGLLGTDGTFLAWSVVILLGLVPLGLIKSERVSEEKDLSWKIMWGLVRVRQLWLLVPKAVAGGFLLGLVLGAIPAIIEKDYGISWVGIIASVFHLTLAASFLLSGYLSDIKGRFKFMYAALGFNILAAVIFLNWQSLPVLFGVMLLLGLGGSVGGGATGAVMMDTFEDKIKEAGAVVGNISLILGVVPAFILPQYLSQKSIFVLGIALSILGIVSLRLFQKITLLPN